MEPNPNIPEWFRSQGNPVSYFNDFYVEHFLMVPRNIFEAGEKNISFISKKYADQAEQIIKTTRCKLIIIDKDIFYILPPLPQDIAFVISTDPKQDMIKYCRQFLGFEKPITEFIHPQACIHLGALIGNSCFIDAFAVIEMGAEIGNNCIIGANTVIGSYARIGNNVTIGSNCVIGGDGFGYSKNEDGSYSPFPHFGKVIIKDNVSIGANTCIDRGSLSDTLIGEGVKIDNLVHIAHNVKVGKNTLIIAKAMVAGSVTIGENCWIAPSSSIRNNITIGNNVVIGLASNVIRDVEDGTTVMGNPARPKTN